MIGDVDDRFRRVIVRRILRSVVETPAFDGRFKHRSAGVVRSSAG